MPIPPCSNAKAAGGARRLPHPSEYSAAPPGDAQEEGHQHGGEGVGRAADHEGKRTRPHHLVDHGHRPGNAEGGRDQPCPAVASPGGCDRDRVGSGGRRRAGGGRTFGSPRGVGLARDHGRARGGGLGLGRAQTAAVGDRHEPDRHIGRRCDPERIAVADGGQEAIAGHDHADHRAGGVQRVQTSDLAPYAVLPLDQSLAQDRERSAHQCRGHREYRQNEQELDEAKARVGGAQQAIEFGVGERCHPDEGRHDRARDADADLEQAVGPDRPRPDGDDPRGRARYPDAIALRE
jgi:hypothetical protein